MQQESGTLRLLSNTAKPQPGLHIGEAQCIHCGRALTADVNGRGEVTFAGCRPCKVETMVEITPDGELGFFPMGIRVF